MKKLKVIEIFAGVGGFRLGLEGFKGKSASSNYKDNFDSNYEVVWSNQWEPGAKVQHANEVYANKWPNANHYGNDINEIAGPEVSSAKLKKEIPAHDVLVGGFPCQDYSVAGVNTKGIEGKKGVLWWNIHRIIQERKPPVVFLENVDRLLKTPTTQRGRDFAIILATLDDLGYDVEWKVINAADYGMPQRRRRVFILAYKRTASLKIKNIETWMTDKGIFANAFPGKVKGIPLKLEVEGTPVDITEDFDLGKFLNQGVMSKRKVITSDFIPENLDYSKNSKFKIIKDVLQKEGATEAFVVDSSKKLKKPIIKTQQEGALLSYLDIGDMSHVTLNTELDKWKYLKGKKAEQRESSKGIFYYKEGPLKLCDPIDKPSRTIITSEGGPGASRFKHLIETSKGNYRRLTPVELERLNMFPSKHTELDGISDTKRAFFMGNALVVGVIEKIGKELYKQMTNG
tara:strand:+ start:141 stop:1511 length:1371 start_codon:yes stop_codon:yes gene_type:complete